jgi:osmotically-inducible protein OsmY
MITPFTRFRARTTAYLAAVVLVALAAHGQVDAVDLTSTFVNGGITIDRLLVYQISGIVLIRGRTGDPLKAREAGAFAARAGYRRVANLIEVVPELADDALVRSARRALEMERSLAGCHFRIESAGGIVQLRGEVVRDVQQDIAVHLISRIDGVKEVRSELTRSVPARR